MPKNYGGDKGPKYSRKNDVDMDSTKNYERKYSRGDDYTTIEELEKEVKRLFGNNDISMPINDFIEILVNIESKRKIEIKRKKMIQ